MDRLKGLVREKIINLYCSVSRKWKRKRFRQFLELVKPAPGETILDLGGGKGAFFHDNADLVKKHLLQVAVADISESCLKVAAERGFDTLLLRENEIDCFNRGQFDIIFCNSVIEHVTLPKEIVGDYTGQDFYEKALIRQRQFAADIERVARKYFVQTPCVDFPVESHSWLPSFYAYPKSRALHVERLKKINRIWIKSTNPDYNLLNEEQFSGLFPNATGVLCNRVLGFPKELIAYRS